MSGLLRSSRLRMNVAVTVVVAASSAHAASIKCVIVGDDFSPHVVQLMRADADGVQGTEESTKQPLTLPLDHLVRLENFATRSNQPRAAALTGFAIILRDGQRWTGTPGAMSGDDLEWNGAGAVLDASKGASGLGKISLKSVVGIASLATTTPEELERLSKAAPVTQDELVLANGDVLNGVITASDAKSVTCTPADGQPVSVDWANVRLLRLASTGAKDPAAGTAPAAYRLFLRDGRVIDGTKFVADASKATFFTLAGGQMKLDAGEGIVAIEHRSARVQMLADRAPSNRAYTPFFPTGAHAGGGAEAPFVWAGRTMRSTLLARPHSVLTWPLDGSMKTFVCRYAIPEGRSLADVTVRVKLGDKVVHEQQHVRAGAPGDLLHLPLDDAKSLTLEVDFGDRYDVQDDLYWIEPALLKD